MNKFKLEAENMKVLEKLDVEWMDLMKQAKKIGLTKEEIMEYIKKRAN